MKKKNNSGISAVPLIIALLLMTALGAFFVSLMTGKHLGAPLLAQSTKAFYIADTGIEFAAIRLRDFIVPGDVDWSDNVTDIPSTPFGGGNFAVAFTNKTQDSVTANSTGTIGNATRVISITFTRQAVLMPNSVNWVSKIRIDGNVFVNSILCDSECRCDSPTDTDPDCEACETCANRVTLLDPPTLPPDAPPLPWPRVRLPGDPPPQGVSFENGIYTFAAGTYFFDRLEIRGGVTVTVAGPVAIWILNRFEMDGSATFNWGGSPRDLLLLSAGNNSDPAEPEFELKGNVRFIGAIYSPNVGTEIEIVGVAQFDGAITGDDIRIRGNTTITSSDPNAGLNAVINASGWREM